MPTQYLSDKNVANFLYQLDRSELDNPAIIDADWDKQGVQIKESIWSFRELQSLSRQCMSYLRECGIAPGDRVLLMVRPGFELIVLCFALFRLRTTPVVIDPGMGLGKFKKAVAHSKPRCLVGIPLAHHVSRFFRKSFASVEIRAVIDGTTFLERIKAYPECEIDDRFMTQENDLAAILFTSGSTGPPKGVCYEHGMFSAQIALLRERFSICRGEIDLPMLPIFALFNPALGMTTVIPQINPSRPAKVDPSKIVHAIQKYQVTNTFGSPVLWRKIGNYCMENQVQLPSLKRILVAGAAAPTQLYRDFESILKDGQMYSPYGATECLPVSVIEGNEVINETAAKTDSGAGICVGIPVEGVQVRIVESVSKDPVDVPVGTIGEILVTGPSVTKAYDSLPKANEASKVWMDGVCWHRMGDLGYLDSAGKLWFCGRKVELVETASGILYPECIEALYLRFEELDRCALIAWKKESALVLQPKPGFWPSSTKQQQAFIDRMTKSLKIKGVSLPVQSFFFKKQLPVDVRHNAKIHRLSLRRNYSQKEALQIK
jgi:acyl-CoA synthetase (AMP-forming)/AMP-acid ligase II